MISEQAIILDNTITADSIGYYNESGFLVAENLLSEVEIEDIRQEAVQIFKGNRGNIEGLIQVEEEASDFDVLRNYIAIHFPHKISEKITEYVVHARIAHILSNIIGPNVKCMQSMLFVKGPGKPGQAWHQDEYYIPTRDRSLTGVWIAVDDADVENGCLWVIPGSHKHTPILRRIPYNGDEFGDVDTCSIEPSLMEEAIPVEVSKGSVVFFNGYLLHSSLRNKTTDRSRIALVSHYMSAESLLPWNWDGRIELKEDMRDIIMVTGKDPYAHKGIASLTYPYLRPEVVDIQKES